MKRFPESKIGIYGYVSSPEIRADGKIKQNPESFVVEEIPIEIEKNPQGKYLYIKVQLRNWDTNRFLIELSRRFGISRKRITYAGAKDKTALTTQYFCINADADLTRLSVRGSIILDSFRSDHMLRLGDLIGNRFSIRLHSDLELGPTIREIYDEISTKGGFPNFFGPQRFGSIRPNTHIVGKMILMGKIEEAVIEYIADPELDDEWYRLEFSKTRDAKEALKNFPMHLSYERTLLHLISEGRIKDSFSAFPLQLRMMFIHAFQSFLFNRVVSERLIAEGDLTEPQPGDICLETDRFGNPSGRMVNVTEFNLQKIRSAIYSGNLSLTAPLPGYKFVPGEGLMDRLTRSVMDEEGIQPSDFKIMDIPEISSSGDRRSIRSIPVDFTQQQENMVSFSLGRGMYATSFLREIVKPRFLDEFSGRDFEDNSE